MELVSNLLTQYQPEAIINFAAESHVDRSILSPNLGIIDISLAKRLSSVISLRNVIIHLYEEIEPESIYSAIAMTIADYAQYQRQILNYLDALEKNNDA